MVTDAPTIWSSPALEVRMNKGLGARFTGWVRADACVTHDFKTTETPNFRTLPVSACPYVGTYVFLILDWHSQCDGHVIAMSCHCHVIPLSLSCHCHVIAAAVCIHIYIYIYNLYTCGCCWRLLAADNDTHCQVVASSLPDHGCRGVLGFAFTIGGRC